MYGCQIVMKRILLIMLVLLTSSCRLTQHYTKYIDKNEYGRVHLKKMKFEKTFTKEMSNKIEGDAIYFNFYEDESINLKAYDYIRFFNSGQYAVFGSNTESIDVNNVEKARCVGYYNIKNDLLLLEVPNSSFSKAGKRVIRKFVIEGNRLKEKRKRNATEDIYTKITVKDIRPVLPDW